MNKNCNCNTPSKYIDVTKLDVDPFESVDSLMGVDGCGNVKVVERPNVTNLGDGNKALFDDGEYKETYTKEEIDVQNEESQNSLDDSVKEINESIEAVDKDLQGFKEEQGKVNKALDEKINKSNKDINEKVDKLDKDLNEKLSKEATIREEADVKLAKDMVEADTKLDKKIDEAVEKLNGQLESGNGYLDKKIDDLATKAEATHTEINTKIDTVKSGLVEDINKAKVEAKEDNDKLKGEFEDHLNKSDKRTSELEDKVNKVETEYKAKDEAILEKLNQEIVDRKEGDINNASDIKIVGNNLDALKEKVDSSVTGIHSRIDKETEKLNLRVDDEIHNRDEVVKRIDIDIDRVEDDIKGIKEDYIKGSVAEDKFATKDSLKATNDRVDKNVVDIEKNRLDIDSIKSNVSDKEHFRGYFTSNDQIKNLSHSVKGDYAYSAETGTKWIFNGETWVDSTVLVPDKVTPASNTLPLVNGEAEVGKEELYARGDHRHPSDPTKADKEEVIKQLNELVELFKEYDKSSEVDTKIEETIEALGSLVTVDDLNDTITDFEDLLSKKVDKKAGYGLSQKDYTQEIHNRLLSWDSKYYYNKGEADRLLNKKVEIPSEYGTFLKDGISGKWTKSDVFNKSQYYSSIEIDDKVDDKVDDIQSQIYASNSALSDKVNDKLDILNNKISENTTALTNKADVTYIDKAINNLKTNLLNEISSEILESENKIYERIFELEEFVYQLNSTINGSVELVDSILRGSNVSEI